MNGDFLTKGFVLNNLSYIFFVIFLMILMVSKGYYVHSLANDISKAEKEVGDITADYVETKAKDRKSTRLNSSHVRISYAVFCLKKKKKKRKTKNICRNP